MRTLVPGILLLTAVVLAGCTTVRVSQDYDPHADLSRHGTWQWQDPVQPSTGDIRIDNPFQDRRIRRAVENHLAGRNLSRGGGRPELYLAYHLTIEQKIQSDTYYSTMGVGSYYHPWYGGYGAETRIRQYDESRLTIDIHGADTGELLWRGVGTFRWKSYKTPEAAFEDVQKTVDKILWQFPPGGQKPDAS